MPARLAHLEGKAHGTPGTSRAATEAVTKTRPGTGTDHDTAVGSVAAASTRHAVKGRTARRGAPRSLLAVAAVTGAALVAGVLVTLSGSGGGAQASGNPKPAASLLDLAAGGGSPAAVPGVLPPVAHRGTHAPGNTSHHPAGTGTSPAHAKPAAVTARTGPNKASGSGSHGTAPAHPGTGAANTSTGTTGTGSGSTAGSGTPATASSTRPPAVSGVEVFSHASHRCITVPGGEGKDGTPLVISDCTGSAAQRWTFASDGTVRAFGLCMDVAGASTANGTTIQLARCNGGEAQQFRLNAASDLTSSLNYSCVDVRDNGTANGTGLQLWSCSGTDNQKWSKE
ncbi:ricin-type beta-trefoil lectin domain protein [Streptomyces sp. NPDC007856]|uniref:ricin-type beta-trefoil lectin domain protein n=1 Tax=Streptomyces sp. NPDC007856 TaxID=3364781 RepID=UPI0036C1B49E